MSGNDDTHVIGDEWGRIKNIDVCSEAEPTTTWPYMMWIQPSAQTLRIRNRTNTAWATVGGGGGGGAPTDAQYLVLALHVDLTAERRLVAGHGLALADGGAGGDADLTVDASDLAGTGLEDDGAEKLRIAAAAAGDGLQGGGGVALAVDSTVCRGGVPVNLLTNGGLEIWQRGAGPWTNNDDWTADRWRIALNVPGGDTISVTRDGVNKLTDSQYALAAVYGWGGSGASAIWQHLYMSDGHYGLRGRTVSARVSIKLAAAVANAVRVALWDGVAAPTYSAHHGNNTNWEELDVSRTVNAAANYVTLWISFEKSCTAYIDNAMLVISPTSLDYQPLVPAEEWERCQRYYEVWAGLVSGAGNVYFACYCTNNLYIGYGPRWMTRKPIPPTVTKAGTWAVGANGQPTVTYPTVEGIRIYAQMTGSAQGYFFPNSTDDTVVAEATPT